MKNIKKIIGSLMIMALIVTGIPNECFASGVFNLPSDTIELGQPKILKGRSLNACIQIQFNDSLKNDINDLQNHIFFENYNYDKSLNGKIMSYKIELTTTKKANDTIIVSVSMNDLQNNYPYFVLVKKGIESTSGEVTTKSYVRLYTYNEN